MKLGIVGSGMIVKDCLEAMKELEKIECTALCVREHSLQKGEILAETYGISRIDTNYQKFLQNDRIDFVYIGIINSEHFSYAKEALQAGKHVILEKPFTASLQETRELIKLAKEKQLFLFEAITTLYFPNFWYVKEQIKNLGNIKMVQCNFSQYSSRYDNYLAGKIAPAFDPKACGGALYDINVYHVHFVLALFGKPQRIYYKPNLGYNGVDTSGILLLEYEGFTAECVGAKDSDSPHFALIQGTKGYIKVNGQASVCPSVDSYLNKEIKTKNKNKFLHRMQHEFDTFEKLAATKDLQKCYEILAHTEEVMRVLEIAKTE